ncbi:MAG: hypothetical protein H7836_04570 [Magnetococcus sp. YQC-3]
MNILTNINNLIYELKNEDSAAQDKEKIIGTTRFIIHKHVTERNPKFPHMDIRIMRLTDNKVLSLALPKMEIPTGNKKVLLVSNYLHNFTWVYIPTIKIPSGNYGAGLITTEDSGKLDILKWDENDNITFIANSKLLNGKYHIINTSGNQFLFFKAKS